MTAVMAASNSEGETDVSIEQSDAAVAINRAAKRTRDTEAQFPASLATLQETAALYGGRYGGRDGGAMHACLIDMWCGNHNQGTYPPNTQFLPADGVAAILAAGSFSVARHFSRDQVGSTCGHVAVGVVSQCADQLAQGKAANHLSFDLKKATCMRRIIEASSALGESKALARNATDAPFLGNLEIEALLRSVALQEKLAAARIASAAGTPSCEVRLDAPMSSATFMEHVTTIMRRRVESGSEKGTVRMIIVNDSYGGTGAARESRRSG